MRKKKPRPEGYDVYVRTNLYNSRKERTWEMWTVRTNGHATTPYEMAVALTQDLNRMNVLWQIRNQNGEVVAMYPDEVVV